MMRNRIETGRTMRNGWRATGPAIWCAVAVMGWAGAALAGGTHDYRTEMTWPQLQAEDGDQLSQGRKIVDIEMRWNGSEMRYTGVWGEVTGAVHGIVGVDGVTWQDFVNDMSALDGRWLDIEVGYFNGVKRWAGIFVEDGDDYGYTVRTTMTEAEFDQELYDNLRDGKQIIDFEAYTEGGVTKFAAVWVSDPNQPRTAIYHHLTLAQVSDLLNPQGPIDPSSGVSPLPGVNGRIIDAERYQSEAHGEPRYAIIVSNHDAGGGLWMRTGDPLIELADDNNGFTNGSTRLVDLDLFVIDGTLRYLGVWAQDVKSLNTVAGPAGGDDPEPINPTLQAVINAFEADGNNGLPQGMLALYAKNIRTNQSISYRASEPMYLASCSKTAMHIRLWQMIEDDPDLLTDTLMYTTANNTGNPWWVDNRDVSGLGPQDFGDDETISLLDQAMMQQSDNATTSMLFELVLGRGSFNRWLAGIDGVGRGFHPMTSITDLDRLIMWQGQVNAFPNALSYFSIPSWRFEDLLRDGADTNGWLQAFVGNGNPLPAVNGTEGHLRYYRSGFNMAEPRAYGRMLEKLVEGDFFDDPATTTNCLNVFGTGTQVDDAIDGNGNVNFAPGLQPVPTGERPNTLAKNGGKGSSGDGTRVINDTVIFQKGPDTIVMVLFSQENWRSSTTVRDGWMPQFGYELYRDLIADLKDAGPGTYNVSSMTVSPNESWSIIVGVRNLRGGDATPYKVRFYASTDPVITATDRLIGTYQTPANHPGGAVANVGLNLEDFPATIPYGQYYLGWIIDGDDEVGEWDDRGSDNTVLYSTGIKLNVVKAQLPFDSNDDDHVDIKDIAAFQACFTGSNVPVNAACTWANFDGDTRNDADLEDYRLMFGCISGPDRLVDPDCMIEPQ